MKYCPKCGTPNEDASIFCEKCGNKFQEVPPEQPLNQYTYVSPQEVPKKKKKKKKWWIIVIILVILIFFWALGSSGDGSSDEPANDPNNSITENDNAINEPTTTKPTTEPQATLGELNALRSAKSYLNIAGFSEKGLRNQLDYEGYSSSEIDYAIKNCDADWNEECAESAKSYLQISSFSRQSLKEQLEYEGFTEEQIEYGLSAVGY